MAGFKKGHTIKGGGRKKGSKSKFALIRYVPKKWDTSFKTNAYNMEEVEHRLQNNLPLDDLIDTMNSKWDPTKRKKAEFKTKPGRKTNNNDKDV